MAAPADIFYLMPFHFPGATAHSIQVLRTCLALAEEGARVRLMVKRNPDMPVRSIDEGLAHYGLARHANLAIETLPAGNAISGALARFRVRRATKTSFYARHVRLAVAASRRGATVVELHAMHEEGTDQAVAAAHGVVTITSALAERARAMAPNKPLEVIPDAVDPAMFPRVAGDHPPRLVYVGQLHDWKGVDVMIRALGELPRDVRALVIGGQPGSDARRQALEALARAEGVADRVEWTGFLPQREIAARLRGGDIAVLPTRAQNGQEIAASPLKLFEYFSMGLPVVATDMPSLRDVIRDGSNGVLFPDGDARGLAGAVKRLLDEPQRRRAIASRAHDDASGYSWKARARRILAFLDRLHASR